MEMKIKNLIIVGDRVLIKPKSETNRTKSGLFLPPGVQSKEEIQTGLIVRTGPGYAISIDDNQEPWKKEQEIKYIPLQAQEGDEAVFLLKHAYEVMYEDEKYYIVPQTAILMLERNQDIF
ncbi:MAG TPA: co-chaperone GroES family protein [Faecalibacter sp.]|uniref:co-chaperone GroES n=1 Tax=Faecalibacter sp. LW9 TaxID=3103144 RepID=UPI002AFE0D33|nr:co-chaperone GroES family protein [Faecalibacter sp. LW9]